MRIKKRFLKLALLAFLAIVLAAFALQHINKDPYEFSGDKMHYSQNRGQARYEIALFNTTENLDIYSVNFESRKFLSHDTRIYGLLFMPKKEKEPGADVPGIVLLPGGGVTKEGEAITASKIAGWGYAVLTIDQRGVGQTGGYYLSMDDDYKAFLSGKEPVQHLAVYDALRAFDVLREAKGVDANDIAVAGESMGAKYAIIAAATDSRLKGAVAISSSGYHTGLTGHTGHTGLSGKSQNNYLTSIDPDNYIADISPRHVFMLHGTNDSVVSLKDAVLTFSLAKEPKKLFVAEGCGHGYCNKMEAELKEDLRTIFIK